MKGKTAIIYYSFEGNTRFAANIIAKLTGGDLIELEPEKKIKKNPMKYLWGGMQVILNKQPELKEFDFNLDDYDHIIIGSPIWAGTFAPPFNTFFNKYKFVDKQISLFCCYAGTEGRYFKHIRKIFPSNKFNADLGLLEPLQHIQKSEREIKKWIINIKNNNK